MSILRPVVIIFSSLFKSQHQLVLEKLALRQQVTMLRQSMKRIYSLSRRLANLLLPATVAARDV